MSLLIHTASRNHSEEQPLLSNPHWLAAMFVAERWETGAWEENSEGLRERKQVNIAQRVDRTAVLIALIHVYQVKKMVAPKTWAAMLILLARGLGIAVAGLV